MMENFVVLETDRLRLRQPVVQDIPRIVRLADNAKIATMTLSIPNPYKEEDAISWLDKANQALLKRRIIYLPFVLRLWEALD